MDDATKTQINEQFSRGRETGLEPDIVQQLGAIMQMHGLPVMELFYKWEAYCIKMDVDATDGLTMERLRAFKQELQDVLERQGKKKTMGSAHKEPKRPRGNAFGILDGLVPMTPATKKKKAQHTPTVTSSPMTPSSTFHERKGAGDVTEILNPQIGEAEIPEAEAPTTTSRIRLTTASDQKKLSYKPLAMKASEASAQLDDRLEDFAQTVQEHYGLPDSAFGSAARQSTAEVVAVGRIASDDVEDGKLNEASLVLETSRRTGGGLRVALDVKALGKYSFFPGQVVAFRGSNTSGSTFVVKEELALPLLPSAASTGEALMAQKLDAPLQVFLASGPYTPDDNLDFAALHALCSQAIDRRVDAVVLTGPFLDVDHPLVATGDFDVDMEDDMDPDTATLATAFRSLVSPALQRLVAALPAVTVLLVPSVRDAVAKHVSWPQDAFSRRGLGLPKAVRIVGNPMTVSLNEVLFGISSEDVLYELVQEGIAQGTKDRLARASRHLLEQRHYFPLFPTTDRRRLPGAAAADHSLATGATIDVPFAGLGDMVRVRPDVLVTPSALPTFAKVVESVVVINPGHLSMRRGAGTYARMTIQPLEAIEEGQEGEMLGHRVFSRARVEIVRI